MAENKSKKQPNKVVKKIITDNENESRKAIFEDLFYDFYRSRKQIYWMNFWRGMFFGVGSVIGVTLFIVLSVWLLGKTADIFPPLADFINTLIETMQKRR